MRNIRVELATETNQTIAKTIERSGWGLLFIWVGVALLSNLGWGIGLLGVGVILLLAQAARMYFAVRVDAFGLVLGICFAIAGLSQLLSLPLDKAPFSAWLIPGVFIVAGAAALVSAWRHRPGA